MHAVLLRLAGPMQSWGTQSRFTERDTGLEPSKSGVLGLLCAALGRGRDEGAGDLAALAMGVRVDREGTLRNDFQTALHVAKADGSGPSKYPVVSNRYYLADADFLVALAGPDLELLRRLDAALAAPRWPLFLGRKAFAPGRPVRLPNGRGVRPGRDVEAALKVEPWCPRPGERERGWPERLRVVLEAAPGPGTERRYDQPGPGAAFEHRQFLPRAVVTTFWDLGAGDRAVPIGEASDV